MRKVILSAILCMFMGVGYAQVGDLKSGLRFAIGESDFDSRKGPDIGASSGKVSFQAGPSLQMNFTKWLGLQGELLFSYRAVSLQGEDNPRLFGGKETFDNKYRFSSINIPLLPTFILDMGKLSLQVFAGPDIAFSLGSNYSKVYRDEQTNEDYGFEKSDLSNDISAVNLGLVAGFGLNINVSSNGSFFVDFRSNNYGDTKIGNVPDANGDIKSAYIATYYIGFGTRYVL